MYVLPIHSTQTHHPTNHNHKQKEAHALRVRVLQALSLGEGAEGGLAEMLEVVKAQGQEAAQLVLQAEGALRIGCGYIYVCIHT